MATPKDEEPIRPTRTLDQGERDRVKHLFTHHFPTEEKEMSYIRIRSVAKVLAETILEEVPVGADQSAALRKLRECVMTANAGIALSGIA